MRTYAVNQSTITLRGGDITRSDAEVLVSSDDGDLSMGGGVSMALLRAAGEELRHEARKLVPARPGEVVVTSAGRHPTAKYLLHAITLDWEEYARSSADAGASLLSGAVVRQAVHRVMELLPLLRCRSVAFPSIGSGVAGIPFEQVAAEMGSTLVRKAEGALRHVLKPTADVQPR